MNIEYRKVALPVCDALLSPVELTSDTRKERMKNILIRMKEEQLDALVVYADREHGANFAYLTGFEPRFEEAVMVLHESGKAYLLLGNENMKMCKYSTIEATAIHSPYFSLPNQPMGNEKNLAEIFADAGIKSGMCIGIVGWKLFTSQLEDNQELFDIPYFIMESIKVANYTGRIRNATGIFIDPDFGVRTTVNANEIAHYEFGAALASTCILNALNEIEVGKTEMEIAEQLSAYGQPNSVTTICATGDRFEHGIVFPRHKKITLGDRFSLTMGLRGGLCSRAAYVVEQKEELPTEVQNYLEMVAIPYYKAAVTWYETVEPGISGGTLYKTIEQVLPKEVYHWMLNPGHLTAEEEWMSSPMFPNSQIFLKSGMMLQMDIIPSVQGYGGASAEDGIVLADDNLQKQLQNQYPEVWERFLRRRSYMIQELGINLKSEILPMSDIAGYMRPYLLKHHYALRKEE